MVVGGKLGENMAGGTEEGVVMIIFAYRYKIAILVEDAGHDSSPSH